MTFWNGDIIRELGEFVKVTEVVEESIFALYLGHMREAVEKVLAQVRVSLGVHGGGIDLVDIEESTGTVTVKLTGACVGCSLSSITLHHGVEEALSRNIPTVRRVVAV